MPFGPPSHLSPTNLAWRLRVTGIGILVTGLAGAVWTWHSTDGTPPEDLSSLGLTLSPDDSARYQRDVELYSGKLGVLMDKWTRKARPFTQGKPLAVEIGIVSVLAGAGCVLCGARVKRPEQPTA
jgi:hypothetical protein